MDSQFEKRSAFALSVTVSCILLVAATNIVYFKNRSLEEILWFSFVAWVVLFFSFLIAKVVYERKRFEENLRESTAPSSNIGDVMKIYD